MLHRYCRKGKAEYGQYGPGYWPRFWEHPPTLGCLRKLLTGTVLNASPRVDGHTAQGPHRGL